MKPKPAETPLRMRGFHPTQCPTRPSFPTGRPLEALNEIQGQSRVQPPQHAWYGFTGFGPGFHSKQYCTLMRKKVDRFRKFQGAQGRANGKAGRTGRSKELGGPHLALLVFLPALHWAAWHSPIGSSGHLLALPGSSWLPLAPPGSSWLLLAPPSSPWLPHKKKLPLAPPWLLLAPERIF